MQVRAATLDDIVGIQRLYAELRPADPPLSVQQAHATLANVLATPGATIFVAELDGELVATCMLATIANFASGGRPSGLIEHVITLHAHRGQGFGRAVLQQALSAAWAQHCCKVLLLSGADRHAAHQLYHAVGFDGDRERGFVIKAPSHQ